AAPLDGWPLSTFALQGAITLRSEQECGGMTNDLIDDLLNAACHEHARQALQDVLVVLSRAGFEVDCALGDAAFTSEIKDGELRVTPPLTLASTDARRVHRIVELCVKRVQESAGAAQVERTLDE